jgi:tellurite resistance protein TehA-like permease
MTPRYDAYLLAIALRDTTFIQLALIAVALVAAWCLVDKLPKQFQPLVRKIYLIGGGMLFVVTLLVTVEGWKI